MQSLIKIFHHKFKCNTSVYLRFANPDLVFHNIKFQENIRQLTNSPKLLHKTQNLMKFSGYKLQGLVNDIHGIISLNQILVSL